LPQGVVPALDVRGLSTLLAHRRVLLRRDHLLIGFPKIRVTVSGSVSLWNLLPKRSTTFLAAVANHIGDDLTSQPTKGNPDPALVGFFQDK
jgi:hypothetical protein